MTKIYNEIVLIWNEETNQYDTIHEDSYDYDGDIYQMAEAEIEISGGKSTAKLVKALQKAFKNLNKEFTAGTDLGEDLDFVLKKLSSSAKFLEINERGLSDEQKKQIALWRTQFGVLERQRQQREKVAHERKVQAQREALDMFNYNQAAKKEKQARKELIAQRKKEEQQTKQLLIAKKRQQKIEEKAKIKLMELNAALKKYGITVNDIAGKTNLVARAVRGNATALAKLNILTKEAITTGKLNNRVLKLAEVRNHRNAMSLSRVRSVLLMTSFAYGVTAAKAIQLVKAYAFQEQQEAKLLQALRSTNFAAGLSQKTIVEYAAAMQEATGIGDELTIGSSALLATFTKIGSETFLQAQSAILDVTSAMYGANVSSETLKTTTVQVGKALNDPIKGVSALSRVGIQFTEDQRKMIKEMVLAGDIAGAQKIILGELETQFGGMGEAMADTTEGKIKAMSSAFSDLQEDMGRVITPGTMKVVEFITKLAKALDPQDIANYGLAIGTVVSVWAIYSKATKLAADATTALSKSQAILQVVTAGSTKAVKALTKGMALIAGVGLTKGFLDMLDVNEDLNERLKELNDEIETLGKNENTLAEEMGRGTEEIDKAIEALKKKFKLLDDDGSAVEKYASEQGLHLSDLSTMEINYINLINEKTRAQENYRQAVKRTQSVETENMSLANQIILATAKLNGEDKRQLKVKEELLKANIDLDGTNFQLVDGEIKLTDATKGFTKENEELVHKVKERFDGQMLLFDLLEDFNKKNEDSQDIEDANARRQQKTNELKMQLKNQFFSMSQDINSAEMEIQKERMQTDVEQIKETSAYKIAAARNDTNAMNRLEKEAAAKTLPRRKQLFQEKQRMAIAEILINNAIAAISAIKDYGVAAPIAIAGYTAMAAMQMNVVRQQKPPAFAQGGDFVTQGPQMIMVGDNPGGRERVQVTPLSSPNINGPQQGGTININFSGNVLSQDFIETEAVPQIKEALRRGGDIGI
ncbi:MAG: hypothetical protein Unbinned2990contig1002_9 [Prokaryotic dsDNA virus sp.]|nr:MAG: hypothetical protein Unbinned2990contig1002_9 [Prokaryotic dsDNA virus sp.]|tara:strand:- start:6235 stop:9195 length:2961 start_codon:yes stop_codon:yes gene_type:complete